jgi:hypothetical protein
VRLDAGEWRSDFTTISAGGDLYRSSNPAPPNACRKVISGYRDRANCGSLVPRRKRASQLAIRFCGFRVSSFAFAASLAIMNGKGKDQAVGSSAFSLNGRRLVNRSQSCCSATSFFFSTALFLRGFAWWLAVLVLISAGRSGAAVFQRDWKTPGDGLLTYDDVNQREWLDLSVSLMSNFPEPRLANAVAQISPGGLFDGFIWARRDDVRAFAQSAGINIATFGYAANQAATRHVIDLLGVTLSTPSSIHSLGFINPVDFPSSIPPETGFGADVFVIFDQTSGQGVVAGITVPVGDLFYSNSGPSIKGLMLYRSVPEPQTCFVSVPIIFCCLNGRRWW